MAQVRKQVRSMRGAGPVKDALRAAQRTEAEVGRLRRRAAALLERTAGRPEGSWRAFENILRVLVDAGETPGSVSQTLRFRAYTDLYAEMPVHQQQSIW